MGRPQLALTLALACLCRTAAPDPPRNFHAVIVRPSLAPHPSSGAPTPASQRLTALVAHQGEHVAVLVQLPAHDERADHLPAAAALRRPRLQHRFASAPAHQSHPPLPQRLSAGNVAQC